MFAIHTDSGVYNNRRYATVEKAIEAARRARRRCRCTYEIVWHNDTDTPKLWVAVLNALGELTRLT